MSSRSEPQKPEPYKIKLCEHWLNSSCKRTKDTCSFAHGSEDLRNQPCKWVVDGIVCKNGNKCWFSHNPEKIAEARAQLGLPEEDSPVSQSRSTASVAVEGKSSLSKSYLSPPPGLTHPPGLTLPPSLAPPPGLAPQPVVRTDPFGSIPPLAPPPEYDAEGDVVGQASQQLPHIREGTYAAAALSAPRPADHNTHRVKPSYRDYFEEFYHYYAYYSYKYLQVPEVRSPDLILPDLFPEFLDLESTAQTAVKDIVSRARDFFEHTIESHVLLVKLLEEKKADNAYFLPPQLRIRLSDPDNFNFAVEQARKYYGAGAQRKRWDDPKFRGESKSPDLCLTRPLPITPPSAETALQHAWALAHDLDVCPVQGLRWIAYVYAKVARYIYLRNAPEQASVAESVPVPQPDPEITAMNALLSSTKQGRR